MNWKINCPECGKEMNTDRGEVILDSRGMYSIRFVCSTTDCKVLEVEVSYFEKVTQP